MGLIIFIIPSALKQSFTLFGWLWLMLIYCERKILLAGASGWCWFGVKKILLTDCNRIERKILLTD